MVPLSRPFPGPREVSVCPVDSVEESIKVCESIDFGKHILPPFHRYRFSSVFIH